LESCTQLRIVKTCRQFEHVDFTLRGYDEGEISYSLFFEPYRPENQFVARANFFSFFYWIHNARALCDHDEFNLDLLEGEPQSEGLALKYVLKDLIENWDKK
jgi:hypothetical protein